MKFHSFAMDQLNPAQKSLQHLDFDGSLQQLFIT